MISLISGNAPQKYNTMEQVGAKLNVTEHAHMSVPQPPIETNGEKVTLSNHAKARFLKDHGRSTKEIAIIMDLDAKTIKSYIC